MEESCAFEFGRAVGDWLSDSRRRARAQNARAQSLFGFSIEKKSIDRETPRRRLCVETSRETAEVTSLAPNEKRAHRSRTRVAGSTPRRSCAARAVPKEIQSRPPGGGASFVKKTRRESTSAGGRLRRRAVRFGRRRVFSTRKDRASAYTTSDASQPFSKIRSRF